MNLTSRSTVSPIGSLERLSVGTATVPSPLGECLATVPHGFDAQMMSAPDASIVSSCHRSSTRSQP